MLKCQKDDFDQRTVCEAVICQSKYTAALIAIVYPFVWVKTQALTSLFSLQHPFFFHLLFLVGILIFWTHHLGLTSKRATASYLYEGLVAAAITTLLIESNFLQALLLYTLPLAFMCVAYYHIVKTLWRRNNIPGSQVS